MLLCFFFNHTATTEIYTLSLHDALPISTLGQAAFIITWLLSIAYLVWNYGYRQGTTGSSVGKSIMKFKVVSEKTWQSIEFTTDIPRRLSHLICRPILYISYPFPPVDAMR